MGAVIANLNPGFWPDLLIRSVTFEAIAAWDAVECVSPTRKTDEK